MTPDKTEKNEDIESHLYENRIFEVPQSFAETANVNAQQYEEWYEASIRDPEKFWYEMALSHLSWSTEPKEVLSYDWETVGSVEKPYVEFFRDGILNASYNCLDRHLDKSGDKVAIHWQGEKEEYKQAITYSQLHREVSSLASGLKRLGVTKGDAVMIYLPMVPELVIAVQACSRIGAIHSVVFSAFSAEALANRIRDCGAKVVITADIAFHNGKQLELKPKVDTAVEGCPSIEKVVVLQRDPDSEPISKPGRDVLWNEVSIGESCEPEPMKAEDPLFILYTSGSTGKPKGVLHTTAGYLLYTAMTTKYAFDLKPQDVFWCTADVGWITGHSYLSYGPLANAASCVMFEGTPTYPSANRFWKIIEEFKVSIFYTAPTALRALMRLGNDIPLGCDLSSLRLLGTVGEPINPEAWIWYYDIIGKGKCPVVDTWWQTETGGILITTLPGAHRMKPGSAGKPFFGISPKILNSTEERAEINQGGGLYIEHPWPGMLRGMYGDKKHELIKKVYFTGNTNIYFSSDGAKVDKDGYYWLLGRVDDVINVSAHRLATAEIESALVSHRSVAEAAVVGFPHEVKGQAIYCFVSLNASEIGDESLARELAKHVRNEISPIATPDKIHFTNALPKTRSGKIMRRILRKIAEGSSDSLGDISTLADPSVVDTLLSEEAFSS